MSRLALWSCGVLMLGSAAAVGDPLPEPVRAHAVRKTGALTIDGHLDEAAWAGAPKQSGFIQRFPKDGVKALFETRFAILYDDDAVYVGVWSDDPEPARIRRLLTRRDVDVLADAVVIGFDSYHDRRTAYAFQLNAAGVQRDMMLFDDSNQDDTWDAVWTGDAAVNDNGWSAEFRIPLNQLRFAGGQTHEWGFQVLRIVARTQEQATWSPWPRSAPEVVSKFGIVDGIDDVKPGRRLELLPYVTSGFEVIPVDAGDPLNDRSRLRGNLGLDLRYGLGPAFTLSATINPDFGQVEADPSQVNLSANELFFAEKRSFFLEGIDLFKLPIGNSDSSVEGVFYSRRIGAAPREPDLDYKFIKAPAATSIYGAAKLTGKTRGGWSIGVLDAVTGQETATVIDANDLQVTPIVAPLTNYAIGRVKRDINDGRTSLGISATAVNRALGDLSIKEAPNAQAYTGGFQLQHRWADNAWTAQFQGVASLVHGTPEAIAMTQRAARHLYQRPDAENAHFDDTRTSLSGVGATWTIGKLGNTPHVRYGTGGDLRTIGLELNDAGFQTSSDRVIPFVWGQYREDSPGDQVLNWQANADVFLVSTLEPRITDVGLECNGNVQLANYWSLSAGCNVIDGRWQPGALRGGAALRSNPRVNGWINLSTDHRKPLRLSFNGAAGRDWIADEIDGSIELGATVQARSNIDIFAGPSWSERDDPMQYVDEAQDTLGETHYVFARIKQRSAAMTVRMNWTFSPHLTLQAYAQPYVASGRYAELKDVDDPHAQRFEDRFTPIGGRTILRDDTYTAHTAAGATYRFDRPDFDFRQLRSTLVVRWEYRPGSTVFAIWSHGRTSEVQDGRFQLGRDLGGLASAAGENVVMVKANYWIGL